MKDVINLIISYPDVLHSDLRIIGVWGTSYYHSVGDDWFSPLILIFDIMSIEFTVFYYRKIFYG